MNELSMVDELALVALVGDKEPGVTSQAVSKQWDKTPGAKGKNFASVLTRLGELGLVEQLPRSKGQRSSRWRLSSAGQNTVRERLSGLSMRGQGWKQKAARMLAAVHVLNVEPRIAISLAGNNTLAGYFLAIRLGEAFHASATPAGIAERVAAAALGAENGKPETLWRELLNRGFAEADPAQTEPANPATPSNDLPLPDFVEQVKRTAQTAGDGWFGPRKLFIHRAWEAWQVGTGSALDLAQFKQRLLEALQAGQIGLTRADFAVTLNPADLATAETKYGDEVFHFISIERNEHP